MTRFFTERCGHTANGRRRVFVVTRLYSPSRVKVNEAELMQ
jgi:hypothetical protein